MAAVLVWLLALSVFDLRERRLPNWLTLPGAAVIPAVAALHGRGPAALAGAGALFAVYLVVHLVAPASLGAGDVKLAPGIGALTGAFGADAWLVAALGTALLSAVWAVALLVRRSDSVVPHGVSMCIGAAAVYLLHTVSR
ncbi:A24 family peptidase [Mycolicibacterium phlei]|uniref:prepilin peptidase n=1 Tax=Mycolicibacterium phlei TaxID=1771 RepID=UPI00025AF2A0|nr:prepilin signal peptidase PulO-like peptidase [Mycolicibacterium phlei RIVM601174]KXW71497.1 peptidase A24 [Mycolicibacterium phlei DSM 43072]KXW73836.1 peptidase A24 [Mycolicibacterium phlei DSM 43070]MBF4190488.1 prepilin signal peptidase PulO-like peptidase [Mycolicibacterium phlei]